MTKMAAMAIYGKNLKKSSSLEPIGQWPWNFVCVIGCLSTTKFAQMMTLGWPWPILRQGQIWSCMLLYAEKVKQWIFQKLLSSMIWNWQQMIRGTRSFCWHQNFVPLGLYAPAPGLYTCIKSWKKLYKIRLQRDFFWNLQQLTEVTRCSCWHQNFVPKGLSAPALGLYIYG